MTNKLKKAMGTVMDRDYNSNYNINDYIDDISKDSSLWYYEYETLGIFI